MNFANSPTDDRVSCQYACSGIPTELQIDFTCRFLSEQGSKTMSNTSNLYTITEASQWVSQNYGLDVTPSNISYLIQYGQVKKINKNGSTLVLKSDLENYYSARQQREVRWKQQIGEDLNWDLSFDSIKESERTKHVHRLHPYKGKYIPQLVEYFLDQHTDKYKTEVFFKPDDIVLDPFCGSGTTLVQANELGINAIGIDISEFNALISNMKVSRHNIPLLMTEIKRITNNLLEFVATKQWKEFDLAIAGALSRFNNEYFPSSDFKYWVRTKKINQLLYSQEKEREFLEIYRVIAKDFNISELHSKSDSYINTWYLLPIREEIEYMRLQIDTIKDASVKNIARIILSRTIRSCRATTHIDLATLIDPVIVPYYCRKHYKICKPLYSILNWWQNYTQDTVKRLQQFNSIRTNTVQKCLVGDARNIDIIDALHKVDPLHAYNIKTRKFRGIFSSPPYVGLIDYHDQHAYAYELFDFERRDELEIGTLKMGKGINARREYVQGIADTLINSKRFLQDNYDIFLVANDQFGLYPEITTKAGMVIVNEFKRPVLHRSEKDTSAYAETIFHIKDNNSTIKTKGGNDDL